MNNNLLHSTILPTIYIDSIIVYITRHYNVAPLERILVKEFLLMYAFRAVWLISSIVIPRMVFLS